MAGADQVKQISIKEFSYNVYNNRNASPPPELIDIPEAKINDNLISNFNFPRPVKLQFKPRVISTPATDFVCKSLQLLRGYSEKDLNLLLEKVNEEEKKFIRVVSFELILEKTKFHCAREIIDRQLAFVCNPLFLTTDVKISKNEEVNGFKLYDMAESEESIQDYVNLLPYYLFTDFHSLIHLKAREKSMAFEKFREEMKKVACSEWNKQTPDGEYYRGYWSYPEDSEEYKDAWNLTFEDNCKALWFLPFSCEAIFRSIKIGCANRQECVRYSNMMCVWTERKIKAIAVAREKLENLLRFHFTDVHRIIMQYFQKMD